MIPAASLILVRDSASAEPEILLIERSAAMTFAAGAFVFPGGRIDPGDEHMAGADAAKVAAIRECIEESGIAAGLSPCPSPEIAREMQDALLAGEPFAGLLKGYALNIDLEALTPFAHWQPGPEVSRRFDTRFFIARAPAGPWTPNPASGECVSARWTSTRQLLDDEARGAVKLIYPTRKTLERLALHDSVDAMLADARAHPVVPITPGIEEEDGQKYLRIPEGLGFPVTRDPLARYRRG